MKFSQFTNLVLAAIYYECITFNVFSCFILLIGWSDIFKDASPVHSDDECTTEVRVARNDFDAGIILLRAQHGTGSLSLLLGYFTMVPLHIWCYEISVLVHQNWLCLWRVGRVPNLISAHSPNMEPALPAPGVQLLHHAAPTYGMGEHTTMHWLYCALMMMLLLVWKIGKSSRKIK